MHALDAIATSSLRRIAHVGPKLVISGAPRSGTTWLAESVSLLTNTFIVWEPLEPSARPHVLDLQLFPDTRIAPDARLDLSDVRHAYLNDVFRLRLPASAFWHFIGVREVFSSIPRARSVLAPSGVLYKLVRGNMMLAFLLRCFDLKGVLLLRHPCAVIASQREMAWQRPLAWKDRWIPFLEQVRPDLVEHAARISREVEVLAWDWAVPNMVALGERDPQRCRVHFYENLFLDWETGLADIADFAQLRVEGAVQALHKRPSSKNRGAQLSLAKWQKRLTSQEIDCILSVAHLCGLTFYTDDPGEVRFQPEQRPTQ